MAYVVEFDPYEEYEKALQNLISEILFLSKYDPIDNVNVRVGPLDVDFVRTLIPVISGIGATPLAIISPSSEEEAPQQMGAYNTSTTIDMNTRTAKVENPPNIISLRFQLSLFTKSKKDMSIMKNQIISNLSKARPSYVYAMNNRSIVKLEGGFADETNNEPGQEDITHKGSFNLLIERAYFPRPIKEYPLIENFAFGQDFPSINQYDVKEEREIQMPDRTYLPLETGDTGYGMNVSANPNGTSMIEEIETGYGFETETGYLVSYTDFIEDEDLLKNNAISLPTGFIFDEIKGKEGSDGIYTKEGKLVINFNKVPTKFTNSVKIVRSVSGDVEFESQFIFTPNYEAGGLLIENDLCFAFIGYGSLDVLTFYYYNRTTQEVFKENIDITKTQSKKMKMKMKRVGNTIQAFFAKENDELHQIGTTVSISNMSSDMNIGIFGYNPKQGDNFSLTSDYFIFRTL
jgi:hypothetical protein